MWTAETAPEFDLDLAALDPEVRIELFANSKLIEQFGPQAKRPRVDTLNGKEGRFYKEMIVKADARFDAHLDRLRKEEH